VSPVVARTLREIRLERDLSLRELAGLSGVSYAVISQIERGRMAATSEEAEAIADALGVGALVTRTMLVHEESR
jgi:transcriptional regulator with XRE-family HTH domain